MHEPRLGSGAPLRVAVLARSVYPLHGYGGLERHVYDLIRHLVLRDVRVTLVTPPPARTRPSGIDPRFDDPRVTLLPVAYHTFPVAGRRGTTIVDRSTAYPWFGYRAGRAAAALVARGQIDIVYGLGASCLGYALARAARAGPGAAPLVLNPQGLEEFGGRDGSYGGARAKRLFYLPLRAAVRRCARAADCVIATDRALAPAVRAQLAVPPERVRLVPNGIDLASCDRLGTQGDSPPEDRDAPNHPLLLSVGRIEESKGFQVLARALATLQADRWRWVLVGDGPFSSRLQRVIRDAGIRDRVVFTGRVSPTRLHAWYERATLFVHPTLYEGSSLVTLEAMAHRRAVVASAAGGLPDKVQPGVTGWLVPPGDRAALADAIREALARREHLPAMGERARALAEREFSWPVIADRLLEVFAELIEPAAG